MKKTINIMLTLIIISALIFSLSGCKSKASEYVGEYNGTSGSYLKLHDDGTCIYAELDKTGTGSGTWSLENNIITVNVSNLDYPIYANTDFDDKGLYFQADSDSWNDEYFVKNTQN